MKKISKIYEMSRLYINCIIIATIALGIFSACAAPRSVRPTGTHSSASKIPVRQEYKPVDKKKEHTKNIKNDDNIENSLSVEKINELEEQNIPEPTAIAGLSTNEIQPQMTENLPSLVQQLRMLNAGQEDIQKGIHEIKTSINEIDSRLTKLERSEQSAQKNTYSLNRNNDKSKIILPDEAVNNSIKRNVRSNNQPVTAKNESTESASLEKNNEDSKTISTEQLKNELDEIKSIVNKRNYDEAIKKLSKMVEEVKDPVTLNVCNFYLGESHFGLRQYSKAIDYYEKVLNSGKSDKNDDAMIGIAEAKFRLGNISEAKETYQKFMKLFPKSEHTPTARKMLQQI